MVVENGRALPVLVALLLGEGVTVGGLVMLEIVGCAGGRPVAERVCGDAVTCDQYSSAGRMERRGLVEEDRQMLFEHRQRCSNETVLRP
ncbi:hypothetical protein [Rhodococcus zopfii]|nr:hypothetical protein [Rhodococcus zopfii]